MRVRDMKIDQTLRRKIMTCPECGGRIRYSKLENGKVICRLCNNLFDEKDAIWRYFSDATRKNMHTQAEHTE